jgi:hypothetical protein
MLKNLVSRIGALVLVLFGLVACGGGGGGNAAAQNPPQVALKNFTFENDGMVETIAAGHFQLLHSVYIDCPRNGEKCAQSDEFASLLPVGNAPLGDYVIFTTAKSVVGAAYREQGGTTWIFEKNTTAGALVLDEPGWLDIFGWVDDTALRGQSGSLGIAVTLVGRSTFEVTGKESTIISAVSAGMITEVTSETIPTGPGPKKLGGLRLVCPQDAVGGCKMTMEVELADVNVPVGTPIDVYAGDLWWYSVEMTQSTGEKFILSSPASLAPGQVVWVSIQGPVPEGKVMIRNLSLTTGDDYPIYMNWAFDCFEGNILTGGCKG